MGSKVTEVYKEPNTIIVTMETKTPVQRKKRDTDTEGKKIIPVDNIQSRIGFGSH